MKKHRRNSGETLIETLAAILLVTLSGIMFLQVMTSSTQLSQKAREMDVKYEQALSAAEEQKTALKSGTVIVDGKSYEVVFYSCEDSQGSLNDRLISYSAEEESP